VVEVYVERAELPLDLTTFLLSAVVMVHVVVSDEATTEVLPFKEQRADSTTTACGILDGRQKIPFAMCCMIL